jgi:hypothetical protein
VERQQELLTMTLRTLLLTVVLGATAATAAGCSGNAMPSTNLPGAANAAGRTNPSGGNGGGGGPTFKVTVNFTGTYVLQGSFTDTGTGSGFSSCGQYAGLNTPLLGWIGPGPQVQGPQAQVGGKSLSWSLEVPHSTFHGPGTYSGQLLNAFAIGADDFSGFDSSVTLNRDGSGSASFAKASAFTSNTIESGDITWTCSA